MRLELLGAGLSTPITGLIIQSLGGLVMLVIAWWARRVWRAVEKIYERLDHLDKCVDDVKAEVIEGKAERHKVSELEKQVAHMKGTLGLALHEPPDAAVINSA